MAKCLYEEEGCFSKPIKHLKPELLPRLKTHKRKTRRGTWIQTRKSKCLEEGRCFDTPITRLGPNCSLLSRRAHCERTTKRRAWTQARKSKRLEEGRCFNMPMTHLDPNYSLLSRHVNAQQEGGHGQKHESSNALRRRGASTWLLSI